MSCHTGNSLDVQLLGIPLRAIRCASAFCGGAIARTVGKGNRIAFCAFCVGEARLTKMRALTYREVPIDYRQASGATAAMRGTFILGAKLIFLLGLTACQIVSPPATAIEATRWGYKEFHDCMDRESKRVVALAAMGAEADDYKILYIKSTQLADEISGSCSTPITNEALSQIYSELTSAGFLGNHEKIHDSRAYAQNLVLNQIKEISLSHFAENQRKQAQMDAPKLQASRALKVASDETWSRYTSCLFNHAKIIALNSAEAAEVVAKAAIASCHLERQAIIDVHRKYNDDSSYGNVMDIADQRISGSLVLEVIKSRAQPPPTPSKPPLSPIETPI